MAVVDTAYFTRGAALWWVILSIRPIAPCGPLWANMTSCTKPEVHVELSSEKDQATATGNMCRKFREVWTCGLWHNASGQTDIQTHTLMAILRTPADGKVTRKSSLQRFFRRTKIIKYARPSNTSLDWIWTTTTWVLRPAHVVQWSNHLGAMCSKAWRSQWPRIDSSLGPCASAY